MPSGHGRAAIELAAKSCGRQCHVAERNDDLFALAMKSVALVYAPAASTAQGGLAFGDVLRAMNAPGTRRLVILLPPAAGFESDLARLRRSGVPYVVLEIPNLLEDIADQLGPLGKDRLWFPSDARKRVVSADAAASAVLECIDAADDGTVRRLEGEELTAAELVERAAARLGKRVRAHQLPPGIYRAGVKLGLWRAPEARLIA